MGRIEESFGLGLVVLVESEAGVADDQGVDTQIEGLLRRGVAGSERVDGELAVQWGVGILAVQSEAGPEELCRRDGHLAVEEWQEIHADRHSCRTDHLLAVLVENHQIVDDEAV